MEREDQHNRRYTDEFDWGAILIGVVNPVTGKTEGGLVNDVARILELYSVQNIIDRNILRGCAVLLLLKFLGVEHFSDFLKILPHF